MNIMGDSTQQSRPSVFGYDPVYPKITDCAFPSTSSMYQPLLSSTTCNQITVGDNTMPINNTYSNFPNCELNVPSNNYSFYPNFNNAPYPMTFPINNSANETCSNLQIPLRCKRKTDSFPTTNVKQHITEERMAEHLSKLHISSETPPTTQEAENSKERRLYMCEAMRKLQTTESIIPATLLNKLEKPCTALVLWRPPSRILRVSNNDIPSDDNNNNNNNNEDEMQDNNTMELDMR